MSTILPDVQFVETDAQTIIDSVIQPYEELTGRQLAEADPVRLLLLSHAYVIIQLSAKLNDAARQTLLYYARDGVLDHKGYQWTTPRLGNDKATAIVRFEMSTALNIVKIIPVSTLVTSDGNLLFETVREAVIAPGQKFVDIEVKCVQEGLIGNGLQVGEIDTLITPLPFIQTVKNITVSAGGTKQEDDDSYRERIQQAPAKTSVAGPTGAYEYHAKAVSSVITDVHVHSPTPGVVEIRLLTEDGTPPSGELVAEVHEKLSDRKVRPLTDFVQVREMERVPYEIDMTYYVDKSAPDKQLIQRQVNEAIQNYIVWQRAKNGRNINPSKLISDCYAAGAKRIDIRQPNFTVTEKGYVANLVASNVVFGGVEDD